MLVTDQKVDLKESDAFSSISPKELKLMDAW